MAEDQTTGPGRAVGDGKSGSFPHTVTIEFCNDQNGTVLCPLTRRQYRGAWDSTNVKNRVPDDRFARMPDLPGHSLDFDGPRRTVRMIDPLSLPEAKELLRDAQGVHKDMGWSEPAPDDGFVETNRPDDRLKTWLYWFRRWVDVGHAKVLKGKLPDMDTIMALPGRVEHNQFDSSPSRDKFPNPEDRPPYAPPAPKKKGRR